ncbi:PEPxxWA-CTERM sorting domain-containing protein [uncultured Sphingomonas sp.]|uniref:PEPxxWA-CTERM sorting domain-containing protein n=1 Tax=uncultured Sphingomonas sp. TaxID=158754 RepID=UPI0025D1E5EC|nr:PEPxxWA-CTERM sorting domain-containing protein [uncultured Sphingomonas sp.]
MLPMVVRCCAVAASLTMVVTAADAARYIQVRFETDPVTYWRLHAPTPPYFLEPYQQIVSGELLIDTALSTPQPDGSFMNGLPGAFVRFTDASLYVYAQDVSFSFSFSLSPVDLGANAFSASGVGGAFTQYFRQGGSRFDPPPFSTAPFHTAAIRGFNSAETLTPYRRTGWASPSPTPEPASWALMIGGFGLVGAALRRRRRPAAVATG